MTDLQGWNSDRAQSEDNKINNINRCRNNSRHEKGPSDDKQLHRDRFGRNNRRGRE